MSTLEHEHIVGRSARCALRLEGAHVSTQHALIRWNSAGGGRWEIRDLGSRNGTFLEGTKLQPGREYPLIKEATIGFGDVSHRWIFEDDGAPQVMVVPLDGGEPLTVEGDVLGIPSIDDPAATLFRGGDGQWRLERPDDVTRVLASNQPFEVGGRAWRLSTPEASVSTATADMPGPEVRQLTLAFAVTRDEEHVELSAHDSAGGSYSLGSRGHNYLLLTLARHRLSDAGQGQPEPLCGWMYQDELIDGLGISPTQLNIDIFRIRRQFAGARILDAAAIIERRPGTKQIRIGVSKIEIRSA